MIVRAATEADIPAMARVTAASYAAGFAQILDPDELATRDAAFFEQRFGETFPRMRVAERGGAICGVTLVTDRHLDMLFVDPAVIGGGVGAELLRDVESCGARTLECFRDNAAARRFYDRHGWRLEKCYEREFLSRPRAFVFYAKSQEIV